MARISVAVCDRCGTKDEKADVQTWAVRRGASRLSGELCASCWDDLLRTYQPVGAAKNRHRVEVKKPTRK